MGSPSLALVSTTAPMRSAGLKAICVRSGHVSPVAHQRAPWVAVHDEAESAAPRPVGGHPVWALHLAQRAAPQDLRPANGIVPKLQRDESGQVLYRGGKVRRRCDGAGIRERRDLALRARQPAGVSVGQPIAVIVRQGYTGARHAQRPEDVLVNVGVVRLSRNRGDNLARQGQCEVRVLEARLRRVGGLLLRQGRHQLIAVGELKIHPIGEGRLSRQPGGVGQEMSQRNHGSLLIFAPYGKPRQVFDQRVVESQFPRVPKLHQGRAGERLADGGDPVDGG